MPQYKVTNNRPLQIESRVYSKSDGKARRDYFIQVEILVDLLQVYSVLYQH